MDTAKTVDEQTIIVGGGESAPGSTFNRQCAAVGGRPPVTRGGHGDRQDHGKPTVVDCQDNRVMNGKEKCHSQEATVTRSKVIGSEEGWWESEENMLEAAQESRTPSPFDYSCPIWTATCSNRHCNTRTYWVAHNRTTALSSPCIRFRVALVHRKSTQ